MPNGTDHDDLNTAATHIAEDLRGTGHATYPYDDAEHREFLRRAARRAARTILQRPIRTFDTGGSVHAVLTDWADNPLAAHLSEIRANKAIDRALAQITEHQPNASPADDTPRRRPANVSPLRQSNGPQHPPTGTTTPEP